MFIYLVTVSWQASYMTGPAKRRYAIQRKTRHQALVRAAALAAKATNCDEITINIDHVYRLDQVK